MKRRLLFVILAVALVCFAFAAAAETVKISDTERADLCAAANGKVLAKIFQGVPAERLETKGKWSRVRVGEDSVSLVGWIRNEYLSPVGEGEWLYPGQDCIPAQGHDSVPLLNGASNKAAIGAAWDGTDEDPFLTVAGILSDNNWLLVALTRDGGEIEWYYAAADSLCGYEGVYVISRAADTVVSLRAEPNTKAKILCSVFGGVYANILFDAELKDGWTRICIGGVAGFMMNDFLAEAEFDVPPYRPPLSPLSKQTARVYALSTGNDPVISAEGDLLSEFDLFTVLARGKTRYLVCIHTDEPGLYRYGWIDHTDLKDENLVAGSTKAVTVRDTPVVGWEGEELGSLAAGQEVTVRWFYSSFSPEDPIPVLDYCDPGTSNWVWIDADMSGDGFEEWGIGFVPVDALQLDPRLVLPDPMGV